MPNKSPATPTVIPPGPVVDHLRRRIEKVVALLQDEVDRVEAKGGLSRLGARGVAIKVPVSFSLFVHYGDAGPDSKRLDVKAKSRCPHAWEAGGEKCLGCGLSVAAIKAGLAKVPA